MCTHFAWGAQALVGYFRVEFESRGDGSYSEHFELGLRGVGQGLEFTPFFVGAL